MNHPFVRARLLLIVSVVISSMADGQIRGYFPKPGPDDTARDVSLIQLIAQPEKFEGKRVRFIGFLRIEFEGNVVYLHREDFEHGITDNGIWIDIPADMTKHQQDEVNMHYVICVGEFTARPGHQGMFSGTMVNVRRLELWSEKSGSTEAHPSPVR